MADKIWNVAAYTRLSRDDGDKAESESIGSQKEIIRAFVRDRDDMVIVKEYVDDGYSGVNFDRPDFQRMLADIKAKQINCVICKDLSRFARNYIDAGRYLEKIFPFMGVRFIAITDNYDSNGDKSQSDALIIPFKNLINDAYCKDISMKIRSQLDIKRKMGDYIGAFAPYGYKKDPENKNRLLVDENAARVVELIFRLRLQGMSNTRIASKLNDMGIPSPMEYKQSLGQNYESGFRVNEQALWNATSIRRVLTNDVYLGTLTQHKRGTPNYKIKKSVYYAPEDWIVIEENHEPIISQTDFDTVQSLLVRDVRVSPNSEAVHLFAGYVYCGGCDCCMTRNVVHSSKKIYHYFICSTHRAGDGCSSHNFSEAKLNKIVFNTVCDQIRYVTRINELITDIAALPEEQRNIFNFDAQITKLNAEMDRYKNLKLNLYSDMSDGIISKEEYLEFRAGYDRKIAVCQQALGKIESECRNAVDDNAKGMEWINVFMQYRNITELNRSAIVNLIERIIINDSKHIEVVFRYQDEQRSAMEYISRFANVLPTVQEKGV